MMMLFHFILLLGFYQGFSTKDAGLRVSLDLPTPGADCIYPDRFFAHIRCGGHHVEKQLTKASSSDKDFIVIDPSEGEIQSSVLYADKQQLLEIQLTCKGSRWSANGTLTVAGDAALSLDDTSRLNEDGNSSGFHYRFHTPSAPAVFDDVRVSNEEGKRRREKRDTEEIFIDALILVGHSVYQRWQYYISENITGSTWSIEKQIKQHFNMLFNSVDLRFKSISSKYNIKVVGINIQDADESEWLNGVIGSIYGEQLIRLIENWTTSNSGLPSHDVVVVYEKETLYSDGDFFRRYEFSQQSTLCNSSSTVVVSYQDEVGMDVHSTTRGIACALGAVEEGRESNCSETDNFLMSSNYSHLFTENSQTFSSCSQTQIQNYIGSLLRSSNVSRLCLTQPENVTEATASLPGQIYSPDVQCYLMYGLDSFYCHHPEDASHSGVCRNMYCYFPGSTKCYSKNAADGTQCGNRKWCIAGRCVDGSNAPATNPECVHGDQRQIGILSKERSCENFIASGLHQCYAQSVEVSCCTSCVESRQESPGQESGLINHICSTISSHRSQPLVCLNPSALHHLLCASSSELTPNLIVQSEIPRRLQQIVDCYYGDRVSIVPNCSYSECLLNINDTSYLNACCDTCRNVSTSATISNMSTVSSRSTSVPLNTSTSSLSAKDSDSDDLAVGLGVGLSLLLLLIASVLVLLLLYKKKLYRVNPDDEDKRNHGQPSYQPSLGNNHLIVLQNRAPSSTNPPIKYSSSQ